MDMNIIYDHQIFSRQNYGGISRYFVELARGLSGIPGASAKISAPIHRNKYLRPSDTPDGGYYVNYPTQLGRFVRPCNDIIFKYQLARKKSGIIHQTYYSKTKIPSRFRTVLTVFDMIHERFPGTFSPRDKTTIDKRLAVDRCDHIICISESTKRDLVEIFSIDYRKISVVYLGANLTREQPCSGLASDERSEIPQAAPVTDAPFILYVGERAGYKNFDRLIEAYASSALLKKNFKVVSFGGGDFSERENSNIKKLDLDPDQILHIGGDDALLEKLYRSASLFVYPSLYEGFGIPPLEAMSFDCPVICSDVSSIPEVVGDAAILFDPSETDSIRYALERAAFDSEARARLVEKGRVRIQQFTWAKCVEETAAVYRAL